jgi:hypothetical protein
VVGDKTPAAARHQVRAAEGEGGGKGGCREDEPRHGDHHENADHGAFLLGLRFEGGLE